MSKVSDADFCFHFDNWPRLVGARKHASVRARDTQEHESTRRLLYLVLIQTTNFSCVTEINIPMSDFALVKLVLLLIEQHTYYRPYRFIVPSCIQRAYIRITVIWFRATRLPIFLKDNPQSLGKPLSFLCRTRILDQKLIAVLYDITDRFLKNRKKNTIAELGNRRHLQALKSALRWRQRRA
ncbi:hypothetical protein TNCV_1137561 [Trichonephila clavipes]|nr:hypothetical protein TNCV_1137561 [Trichonephila clavipes]